MQIWDEQGKIVQILVMITDVTECQKVDHDQI
jgi:hypothetical protein